MLTRNGIAVLFSLIAFGCGGVKEISPVTEPGANATEAQNADWQKKAWKWVGGLHLSPSNVYS